jgi:uncharacterized protein YcfL
MISCTTVSEVVPFIGSQREFNTGSGIISILNDRILESLEISPTESNNNDLKVIQIALKNTTRQQVSLRYRVDWFNEEGILIGSDIPDSTISIMARDTRYIKANTASLNHRCHIVIF